MLPPIISTTPNSPTVWAKPSTAPVRKPGPRQRHGDGPEGAQGEARSVAATSSGRVADGLEGVADRLHHERHRIEHRADHQAGEGEGERARRPKSRRSQPPGPSGPSAISR